ncbi:MAG TPA: type II secretion system protein [Polyangiaceae bacterium]|nr:type II secretion system protein [Polyangiaceae bacterium]
MTARARSGFTLLEVLVAIAILGLGLTAILSAQTGLFASSSYAEKMSVATGLIRCKMSEIELKLTKDGYYPLVDMKEEGPCCGDEPFGGFQCKWRIEKIELPLPPTTVGTLGGPGGFDSNGSGGTSGSGGGTGTSSSANGLGPLGALASLGSNNGSSLGQNPDLGDVSKFLAGSGPPSPGLGPTPGSFDNTGSGGSFGSDFGSGFGNASGFGNGLGNNGVGTGSGDGFGNNGVGTGSGMGFGNNGVGTGSGMGFGSGAGIPSGTGSGSLSSSGAMGAMGTQMLAPLVMGIVYPSLKPMLEASIRKLTVTVEWKEGRKTKNLAVTQFITSPQQGGLDPLAAAGLGTAADQALGNTGSKTAPVGTAGGLLGGGLLGGGILGGSSSAGGGLLGGILGGGSSP